MRITLVHYSLPPVVGGVERVVARHARSMADAGHWVTVVAARGSSPDRRIRLKRIGLVDSLHPSVVAVQRELDGGVVSAAFGRLRDRLVERLAATLQAADVVVCHNVCSLGKNLALTAALHIHASTPGASGIVLWHHDLAWAQVRHRATLHPGYPWDLLRGGWPGAMQVVVSEARRIELAALLGVEERTIRVVPNGTDLADVLKLEDETLRHVPEAGLPEADPLLLMPVRIMPRKNVELGLRVVAAMREQSRPAMLVVTGPVDPHDPDQLSYLDTLERLVESLGLGKAARFAGRAHESGLPDRVVSDLFGLADALFLPSRDEGFGIPVLEAAIRRLPVVCSDLPALREVAGDAALYIDPDDPPAEVAGRILERLDRDPVAALARRVRTGLSWQGIYDRSIASLLEEAVASRGAAG